MQAYKPKPGGFWQNLMDAVVQRAKERPVVPDNVRVALQGLTNRPPVDMNRFRAAVGRTGAPSATYTPPATRKPIGPVPLPSLGLGPVAKNFEGKIASGKSGTHLGSKRKSENNMKRKFKSFEDAFK